MGIRDSALTIRKNMCMACPPTMYVHTYICTKHTRLHTVHTLMPTNRSSPRCYRYRTNDTISNGLNVEAPLSIPTHKTRYTFRRDYWMPEWKSEHSKWWWHTGNNLTTHSMCDSTPSYVHSTATLYSFGSPSVSGSLWTTSEATAKECCQTPSVRDRAVLKACSK